MADTSEASSQRSLEDTIAFIGTAFQKLQKEKQDLEQQLKEHKEKAADRTGNLMAQVAPLQVQVASTRQELQQLTLQSEQFFSSLGNWMAILNSRNKPVQEMNDNSLSCLTSEKA